MSQITGERVEIEFDAVRNPKKDVFKEIELRTRAVMSKDAKLSYKDAYYAVFRADPELHTLYLNTIPPLRAGGA